MFYPKLGPQCETPLGECWDLPCQNGGICHEIGGIGDGYVCQCKEGFKVIYNYFLNPFELIYQSRDIAQAKLTLLQGVTCNEKIMKCTNNPCLNNAKCLVSAFHF